MKADRICKATLFALLLPFAGLVYAQIGETMQIGGETCSYFGESIPRELTTFKSDKEAEDVIQAIVGASGLPQNFEIRAGGVPNAAAVIRGDKRFIIYDQYFVRNLTERAGTRWAAISVMAHEIGHHLSGHTLMAGGSRPRIELEADYYSGFVLQKMGATIDQARKAMEIFGSPQGSSTHPAKHDRLASITNGWSKSCQADPNCKSSGNSTNRTRPEPEQTRPPDTPPKPDGPNSCEYANDGTCDEPDLCARGTDTNDCRRRTTRRERQEPTGFPSGHGMMVCGCWGFNPAPIAPEPQCASGQVRLNICPGFCPTGGSPYAYVCR